MAEKPDTTPPETGEPNNDDLASALEASFDDAVVETTETEEVVAETEAATDLDAPEEEYVEDDAGEDQPAQVLDAPEHWPADLKEEFAGLDEAAQKILLERDKAFHRGLTEKTQQYAEIDKVLDATEQFYAPYGMSKAQAVGAAMQMAAFASQDPEAFLEQFAQTRGIDLAKKYNAAESDDEEWVDPRVAKLEKEIEALRASQDQSQQSGILQQIEAFKSAKDAEGNPAHPRFEELKSEMAPLVQAGKSLEEAYAIAERANPDYFEEQLKARVQEELKKQAEAARKKAAKARKAASGVKAPGKENGASTWESTGDVRDDLERAFEELSSGASI